MKSKVCNFVTFRHWITYGRITRVHFQRCTHCVRGTCCVCRPSDGLQMASYSITEVDIDACSLTIAVTVRSGWLLWYRTAQCRHISKSRLSFLICRTVLIHHVQHTAEHSGIDKEMCIHDQNSVFEAMIKIKQLSFYLHILPFSLIAFYIHLYFTHVENNS